MTCFRAPLRISFFGGGTDLPEYYTQFGTGRVLSVAIDRYAYGRVQATLDLSPSIFSANKGALIGPDEYLYRVMSTLREFATSSCKAFVSVDVPMNSGLGGSSAAAVALTSAYYSAYGILPNIEHHRGTVAEAAYRGEVAHNHTRIGKQDQYASAFGGINLIEFEEDRTVVDPLYRQIPRGTRAVLEEHLLLIQLPRKKTASQVLSKLTSQLGAHNVQTLGTLSWATMAAKEAALALSASDFHLFGELLREGWRRKLALSYSSYQADAIITHAIKAGALAGKECGAGGYILLLTDPQLGRVGHVNVIHRMDELGLVCESLRFNYSGVQKVLGGG